MAEQGKRLSQEDREAIIRLRLGGVTIEATAEARGCSEMTVKRIATPKVLQAYRDFMANEMRRKP
jgi:DNA-directed RNA polymerase specialized sigma24 family protein